MKQWTRAMMVVGALLVGARLTIGAPAADAQQRPSLPTAAPIAVRAQGSSVTSPHGSELKEACASCHRADGWKPARIARTFKHAEKTFPLSGAHERASCGSCHKTLTFQNATSTCAGCHTDPHQGEFGTSCARCHTTRTFVDRGAAVRTHQASRFPLRGAHAIATCEACHAARAAGQAQFATRATTCESCHLTTFRATRAPNHETAHFSRDCTSCHTISTWTGAAFDHNTTKFPLTGKHLTATCQGCHSDNVFAGRSMACASCHQADYAAAREPRHDQGFPTTCESCHGTAGWKGARFDHQTQTKFPLTGKHVAATCRSCHTNGVYAGLPSTCQSCHQTTFDGTTAPPHKAAGFATACESCHTTAAWAGGRFDHNTTRFALTGGHRTVTCVGCHADGVYKNKSMACASCHQGKADATTNPHHGPAGFAVACESCHTTTAWAGARFDHSKTRFALTGKHVNPTCLACHSDRVYAGKPSACASCHQAAFDATTTPPHKAAGFASACESCHTTAAWAGGRFDHNTTRFALVGAHRSATCASCHADGVYKNKPMTCASCHQAKFDAATRPNHRTSGFPTSCETCHSATTWTPAAFDHAVTRFPLTGAHQAVSCLGCHNDGVYKGKPTTCASCHQGKFDASTSPHHGPAGFAATCESCHTTQAWTGGRFDHNATRFPLTGKHVPATCLACHSDRVYRGKPSTCASCHQNKYDAATDPNHRMLGFPTTCESCHTTNLWEDGKFDHNATRFPLTGGHLAITCKGCHADNVFRGKPTNCAGCHQAKFDATTNPHHAPARFATACEGCHTTTKWQGARYDHNATRFPLTGKHISQTCLACHSDRVYTGKPSACASCHQAKFDATTNPNHRASAFPTTCESCHSTATWSPATFDHNATRFPLTNAHRAVSCTSCHGDGVYKGKPTTCVSCHQTKFDATTAPNHRTSAFPTTCETCHTSVAWKPATFDHNATRFALTGGHRGVTCASCHGDGVYKGKSLVCSSCHQARFDATTRPNHRTSAFPNTCESCHTSTAWTPATFDHAATRFPLVGAHRAVSCIGCHSDGVYRGKPMTCVSCHQAKFNATTTPKHRTSGFPTTCETCHTATAWTPASFDHNATAFPLAGAHRTVTCSGCHGDNVYKGKTKLCAGCHQTKFDATTRPNHRTLGYASTCESCHTTTAWTPSTWSHATTRFPLTGAHISTTCLACHSDLVYRGKPSTCSACHTTDYNATTNPNHRTAAFPTTCESCHTTTKWLGATFNHDGWFPVYSGRHRGTWTSCTQCHTNSANFKEFTCLTCHLKTNTDNQHRGRNGYTYTSPACYSCHPRGTS